jgi:hypothetical protein
MAYTTTECINALEQAAKELGKSPTHEEYRSLDISPSASVIKREFGSWNEAKDAASMDKFTVAESGPSIECKPEIIPLTKDEWESLTRDRRTIWRKRAHVNSIKLERGCSECGFDEAPAALSFHHTSPEIKKMSVSDLVNQGHSYETIDNEISKCELLCANCHRIREYEC